MYNDQASSYPLASAPLASSSPDDTTPLRLYYPDSASNYSQTSYIPQTSNNALPSRSPISKRTKIAVAVTGGCIIVTITAVAVISRFGKKNHNHNDNPPEPPGPKPCPVPPMTYSVRQPYDKPSAMLCIYNNQDQIAWFQKIAFLTDGNPPDVEQSQWIFGALMENANVSVSRVNASNHFEIRYGGIGASALAPNRFACEINYWNETQPSIFSGQTPALPQQVTLYGLDGRGHYLPMKNDSCVPVEAASSNANMGFLDNVFSLMPSELFNAFQQSVVLGCEYTLLVQLSQQFLSDYLMPKGYSEKQIYCLSQLIKAAVMTLQGGWLSGALTLGSFVAAEAMPYFGAPKIAGDLVGTAAAVAVKAVTVPTAVVMTGGSFLGGLFAHGAMRLTKVMADKVSQYFEHENDEKAQCKI